ncbi:MAG: M15 family metallopeptidase [Bacteroidales bacterium]
MKYFLSRRRKATKMVTFFIVLFFGFDVFGQTSAYPPDLKIIHSVQEYLETIRKNPAKEMVDLEKVIPGIVLDIRYSTTNNFTGIQLYKLAKAFARKPVADSLAAVQRDLNNIGLGIKIYDAYRPYSVTVKIFEIIPDSTYAASPAKGSKHNTGSAIDLTLVDLKTGKELAMPTEYDNTTPKAWHSNNNLSAEIIHNRSLLSGLMVKHGFVIYEPEWWHYSFKNNRDFELMDIGFEELLKVVK